MESKRRAAFEVALMFGAAASVLSLALAARQPRPEVHKVDVAAELASPAPWHLGEPSEDEGVLAYWDDPYAPRSHVCRIINGMAYEGRFDASPVRLLEEDAPTMWRALP